MTRIILLSLSFLLSTSFVFSQSKKNIYFIPGQGSDKRIFDSLKIDTSAYECIYLEYGTPEKQMTMKDFAKEISMRIDTSNEFILVGVSMGGMICVEISEILHPEKTIIISSAKNRNEFPFRYKFQKAIPLYRIIPSGLLFAGAKILQPLVEPDRNNNKETFKKMLSAKNPFYIKRTIGLIINWDRTENTKKIIHIHGTKDHTLPFRRICNPDYVIEEGSHMMTLTQADKISEILNSLLESD